MTPEQRAERAAQFRAMVEAVQATPVDDEAAVLRATLGWLVDHQVVRWCDMPDGLSAYADAGECCGCDSSVNLPDWVRDVLRSVK